MTQEITVTKTEDHYQMQFGSGSSYPVPTNAIDKLDDELTPEEVGESVTFGGEYGGHKHAKIFDVEEVIETPGDDEGDNDEETGEEETSERDAEPTVEHVEESGYNRAAGRVQQAEAQRLFGTDESRETAAEEFDFVCPNCGDDANDSTEKPYCSADCASEALADVEVRP